MSDSFTIEYAGTNVIIEKLAAGSSELYKATFNDHRAPLFLTVMVSIQGERLWTSVPEGRQKVAQEIGLLIDKIKL